MNTKLTIFLVFRKGGDYTYKDVALLVHHINKHWVGDLNIKCLCEGITESVLLTGNLELLPMKTLWPGWWSKMNLFDPELEKYRPFLYMDLDTAIVGSLNKVFPPKDITQFVSLENVYFPGRMGSGIMWFPANNEKISTIWREWLVNPTELMKRAVDPKTGRVMKGDQDFIEKVALPDSWFDEKVITSVKPLPKQHVREKISPEFSIVYFHGKPRPRQAQHIPWIADYVNCRERSQPESMDIKEAYVINLDDRPDRLEEFKTNKFPFDVVRFAGIKNNVGIQGCNESHLTILRRKHRYPFVIFEDDCKLLEDWSFVEKAMKQLPYDWDILYLGANLNKPIKRVSENLYRLQDAWTTHAIIYGSQRVVDYAAERLKKGVSHIDVFYAKDLTYQFNCYITHPMAAIQRPSRSDIMNGFRDYQKDIETNFAKYAR
jgi:hypothetical protein